MKKMYETPVCQTICTAEDDVLTTSKFLEFEFAEGEVGEFGNGAVIEW